MREIVQKKANEPRNKGTVRVTSEKMRRFNTVGVLQGTIGNHAMQRLFQSGHIQTKLKIGAPNDIYEQEADRVANQVMKMPAAAAADQPPVISEESNSIQLKPS